jgi:hypothetical protein
MVPSSKITKRISGEAAKNGGLLYRKLPIPLSVAD